MLKEVLCLLLVGMLFVATSADRDCESNADCNSDECCVEYFLFYKKCKNKADDVGDRCLGQFNCDCKQGLTCQLHEPSFYNYFKVGQGTCVRK